MKNRNILSILLSVICSVSYAGSEDIILTGALLFGGSQALSGLNYSALREAELPEWKEKATSSTFSMTEACGVLAETHLIGDNYHNHVWVVLKNKSNQTKAIDASEVEMKFSTGVVRYALVSPGAKVKVERDGTSSFILPFPSKEDFVKAQSISVAVPIEGEDCTLKFGFTRNPETKTALRTINKLPIFEFDLNYGYASFNGNVKNLVNRTGSPFGGMEMRFWGGDRSGVYLNLKSFDKNPIKENIKVRENWQDYNKLAVVSVNVGYINRFRIEKDRTDIFGIGVGTMTFGPIFEDRSIKRHSSNAIETFLESQYVFKRVSDGIWSANYYTIIGLSTSIILDSRLPQGTRTGGQTADLKIGLGMSL